MGCKHSKTVPSSVRNTLDVAGHSTKVVLLGNPRSGASAVFNQATILSKDGISTSDRDRFIYPIHRYVLDVFDCLVTALRPHLQDCQSPVVKDAIEVGKCLMLEGLQPEHAHAIFEFWNSAECQEIYSANKVNLCLKDNTSYFMSNIERISALEYIPTHQDILHSSAGQAKDTKELLSIIDNTHFHIVHARGNRQSQLQVLNQSDDVNVVVLVVPVGDFDHNVDGSQGNSVQESLSLFQQVSSQLRSGTSIIVLLNKSDLLKEKLEDKVQFSEFFPEFAGENTHTEVVTFVQDQFRKTAQKKDIAFDVCCAMDADCMRSTFQRIATRT